MIFTTAQSYASACGIQLESAWRHRLYDLPHVRGRNSRWYFLIDCFPTIKKKEVAAGAVQRLFDSSEMVCRHFAAPDVCYGRVKALEKILTEEQADRLFMYRCLYTESLANQGFTSSEALRFHERARMSIVWDAGILRAVMTGDESRLPDFNSDWPVSWSEVNAIKESLHNEEAA